MLPGLGHVFMFFGYLSWGYFNLTDPHYWDVPAHAPPPPKGW